MRLRWAASFAGAALLIAGVTEWGLRALPELHRSAAEPAARVAPPSPVIVAGTGREFHWHFVLVGHDGRLATPDDVALGTELHLPQGAEVRFLLTSDDYVYTLSIPQLQLREIAVPELTHELRFIAPAPGELQVVTDPLCAVRFFHGETMGKVTVQPRQAFEEWFANLPRRPAP